MGDAEEPRPRRVDVEVEGVPSFERHEERLSCQLFASVKAHDALGVSADRSEMPLEHVPEDLGVVE